MYAHLGVLNGYTAREVGDTISKLLESLGIEPLLVFVWLGANGVLVMVGSNVSFDRKLWCIASSAAESMIIETPVSDKGFFSGTDSTPTQTLVASISMIRTGLLEACLMQHGESATNVSVLDELSPRVAADKALVDRGVTLKPLSNTTPFREDIRKETLLDESDERTLHVRIR